ncbi:sodium- and chloride-dependent glycine transporter 2-like isoform X2 [Palaemon carinicauda]|uniref:sodium- and chloride-dependent glycine transporter 2-like isoform X2 n=1 Tax=Palaemon carinicauda TaxID=392227 RepID=UPI0035B58FAF
MDLTPGDDTCVFTSKETALLHFPREKGKEKNIDDDDRAAKERKVGMDETVAEKRAVWDSKCDYIMSLLGYAVGLGNIWRFPYLCYKNGGGAFLVPYFLMLFFVGIPLFLLEVSMSQFCSTGGVTIYSVCPALVGSGFASIITNIAVHSYYSLLLSYPLLFIFHSFTETVPWGTCGNWWNTDNCYLIHENFTSMNVSEPDENRTLVSSADEFFHRKILNITGGIDETGDVMWNVMATNIFVWIIAFLCIFQGIKITGKVVWFTATFPILMLLILLVRGVTLPGAVNGLRYYLYPNFEKLKDGQVWAEAATQIFFSLGPGWSTVITMGSYNKFRNNCLHDAVLIPIMNSSCSILAGFVVFSVLGFMAHEMGTTVDKVTAAGPALVFITYPEALSMMPLAPFWSVLFFAMLFFVGLDSLFVSVEASIASMLDRFPWLSKWRIRVTAAVIFCMFLMCCSCTLQGGMYILQLMDWYTSSMALLCVCLCEVFIFSYSYGVGRTIRDIQMMTQKHVNYYWYFCLLFVTPMLLIRLTEGFTHTSSWGPLSAERRAQWKEYCNTRPLRHKLLHPDCKPLKSTSYQLVSQTQKF